MTKEELLSKYRAGGYKTSIDLSSTPASPSRSSVALEEASQKINADGIGEPTFKRGADESFLTSAGKTIGNIPSSALNLAKNVGSAIIHPVRTAKAIGDVIGGTTANVTQYALENTDFGQSLLEKMNEFRKANNIQELPRDENGKIVAPKTEAQQIASAVGEHFKERYGGAENVARSIEEDPVGVLADVAAILTGGGGAVRALGEVGDVARIARAGEIVQAVGSAVEPLNVAARGAGVARTVAGAASETLPGRIISEALPNTGKFAKGQIVKALDLTPGDISNIAKSTGNEVSDFVVRNNLLKGTPEQTADALNVFKRQQYDLVREEVAKVNDIYQSADVPRVQQALNSVNDSVSNTPGLEEVASEVTKLLGQKEYSLSDIQRVKEILDKYKSIYNRVGEAKGAATAQGLDNIRKEIRSFIEDEVSKATNGNTNIRQLNNDVSTSRKIEDAITNREFRGQARQYVSVFDLMLGGGAYAAFGPVAGGAILIGKKLSETPTFRIALARSLKAQPLERIKVISEAATAGRITPEMQQTLRSIVEQAKANMPYIESGSNAVGATMQDQSSSQR